CSVVSGGSPTLSWNAPNATSCTASGGWSGAKAAPSGSQVVGPLSANTTFTLTCSASGYSNGADSVTATIIANQDPIGVFDGVFEPGNLAGWGFDPDSSTQSIYVHIYVDGPAIPPYSNFVAQVLANQPSPDVNAAYGITGNHRLAWTIPSQFRNGVAHTYYLYLINAQQPGNNPQALGSPKTYTFPKPNLTNVVITEPDYCSSGPAATVTWNYNDGPLGSTAQSQYQVQIDNQPAFNSPEVDVTNSGGSTTFISPPLSWNTTWNARVRAWDGDNNVSDWVLATCSGPNCIGGNQWKTPQHAYPDNIDFTWSPIKPIINQSVLFTSLAQCFDNSNNPVTCATYNWNFGDGVVLSGNYQTTTHTFPEEKAYSVSHSVIDQQGNTCPQIVKSVVVQKPIPDWKEVLPR
ncbi:MAG: PKD domain-containing protein, partial [Candidatus Yanofskybacteria bacterium]|nr:PKD domain-containing protein [Candidatus Yanofskybacteria bacterium]